MWQEILITDVTQMSEDRVCVAGIDHQGNCVRPIPPYPGVIRERDLYDGEAVLIRPRAVVNLFLETDPDIDPPHIEDRRWPKMNMIEPLRQADDKTWRRVLEKTASASVEAIFETEILNKRVVAPGTGARSLGVVKAQTILGFGYKRFVYHGIDRRDYRMGFYDPERQAYAAIKINDLSLQAYCDHLYAKGLEPNQISEMIEQQLKEANVWLRLGLTRPYEGHCWLQITGVCTFPDYLQGRCFADYRAQPILKPSL